jgi:hypothetical protein
MGEALNTFKSTSTRAAAILELPVGVENSKILRDDLIRSALVLAVAGFDRYFTHVFVDNLSSYLKNNTANDELIATLNEMGVDYKFVLGLLVRGSDRPFRTVRNRIQGNIFYKTTQQTDAIDKLFKKINIFKLTDRVCKKSRTKLLLDRINKAVNRRHKIVHEGDLNSHHKASAISKATVELYIRAMDEFVDLSDKVIHEEIKKPKSQTRKKVRAI